LVEPTLRLERLDGDIADMQKAIDKLKAERERLGAYVQAHRALISPVRRIPLDLLQEIFMACLPAHRNCVMSARESPVLLGRICSSWRAISLSTPRLWARLHIVEPARPFPVTLAFEEKLTQRLETTKTWLGRSGQCPLSISLAGGVPDEGGRNFLRALLPFAHRWQHIQVNLLPFALETLTHLAVADVPMLESVTLYQNSDMVTGGNFEWGRLGLLRAPRISSFGITGSNYVFSDLPLRWHQLTTLSMLRSLPVTFWHPGFQATITSETALQIISRCPELRSCGLRVDDATTEMQAPRAIVEHPFLHTFKICSASATSTFELLFGRLSLPNLQDFAFRVNRHSLPIIPANGPHTATANAIPALASFLAASTRLTSLELDNDPFSKQSLVQILRSFPPTIQRLRIHDIVFTNGGWGERPPEEPSPLDDDVLALLIPSPAGTAFCPALEELYLFKPHTISDLMLLRLVVSRMAGGPCTTLKRVRALFSREAEDDIMPELQPYIANGLDIHIDHPPPLPQHFSPWDGLEDAPFVGHTAASIF
ncbi:hypothetical protein DFH09DRAFT_1176345, partial [Mycena vulgaris]